MPTPSGIAKETTLQSVLTELQGTLDVNDAAGLVKLEAIRSLLTGTLTVDTELAAAGPLATQATLAAIQALLSGTLNVETELSAAGALATQATLEAIRVLLVSGITVDTELSAAGPLATQATLASVLSALQGTLTVDTEMSAAGPLATQATLDAIRILLLGTLSIDGDIASGTTDSGDPLKIGGRAGIAVPTPVADGQRVNEWFDKYGRPNVALANPELNNTVQTDALRRLHVAQPYTVLADSVANGLAAWWTSSTTGSGVAAAVSGGEGTLQSGAAINSSSQIVGATVRYFPGQVSWLNSAIRLNNTGSAGNVRRIGPLTMSGTTPQDGFCFELIDTTLYATVYKAGAIVARVDSSAWSRVAADPFTLDTNYHSFEFRWTANSVSFLIDNVVRHVHAGTTAAITTVLDFPMMIHTVNTTSTTNNTISVRNIGIGRFGTPPPEQRYGSYGGQSGVSGTVNVPAGAVVRSFAAYAGTSNAQATVPGISGTVLIPGSNQSSSSFDDDPPEGTMVGPCTFVFTNTVSYTVVWVV